MALTPEKVESYTADHLVEMGSWIGRQYPRWDDHFTTQTADLQRLGWEGQAAEKTIVNEQATLLTVQALAEEAAAAQATAMAAATSLMTMRGLAQTALEAARTTGYQVDQDFGVKDTMTSYPSQAVAQARQQLAQEHAQNIAYHVGNFQAHQQAVAQALRTHGKTLQGHVQMVDNKTGGGDQEPGMPDIGTDHIGGGGGQTPLESGLGGPPMPQEWPPKPPAPPPHCSPDEFYQDLKKATEHTAVEAGGLALLPAEGPAVIPGIIGLIINGDQVADDVGNMAKCFGEGGGG